MAFVLVGVCKESTHAKRMCGRVEVSIIIMIIINVFIIIITIMIFVLMIMIMMISTCKKCVKGWK